MERINVISDHCGCSKHGFVVYFSLKVVLYVDNGYVGYDMNTILFLLLM